MQAIAVLPPGMEDQGAKELLTLGAKSVRLRQRSVAFEADTACFYRIHLKARLPFRLLREVARFSCDDPESLYIGIQKAFDWRHWLPPSTSFRVDVSGSSKHLNHSHFTALQVKNALVDLQRDIWGKRSVIDLEQPHLCLHVHLNSQGAVLSLDGSAESLHKRGYRPAMGVAPLKENLAAGLIEMTGWDADMPLVDPLCGSGTLLIEAVSSALRMAPGLNRPFLLMNWIDFDENLWMKEKQLAKSLQCLGRDLPLIIGCEHDPLIAKQAQENICSAGLERLIQIKNLHFRDLLLTPQRGLIVCNPPYGKRIGLPEELKSLYSELGEFLKSRASGWQFWLLSGNRDLSPFLRMKSSRKIPVSNGGIDCRWMQYLIR